MMKSFAAWFPAATPLSTFVYDAADHSRCLRFATDTERILSELIAASDTLHLSNLRLALDEALKSPYVPTAFCVGAVITTVDNDILSTGFSRELPTGAEGELHAEHCALVKLANSLGPQEAEQRVRGARMYTTMEPCSVRKSGSRPCCERIIEAGIAEVYLGVTEPGDFVVCEGTQKLLDRGIKVFKVEGLEEECLKVARGQKLG